MLIRTFTIPALNWVGYSLSQQAMIVSERRSKCYKHCCAKNCLLYKRCDKTALTVDKEKSEIQGSVFIIAFTCPSFEPKQSAETSVKMEYTLSLLEKP